MKRRLPILIAILIVTLFFLYQLINPLGFVTDVPLLKLRVDTNFADLLPQRHPYIKIHNKIREYLRRGESGYHYGPGERR